MVDSIGVVAQLAVSSAPVSSTPRSEQPVLPTPAATQSSVTDQISLSASAAANAQPLQPKPEYANPQVLGTEAVTMYMVNGQLYTRYRDENTGKVTYVPKEAEVVSGGNESSAPAVNITA